MEVFKLLLAGGAGALIKDLVKDNCLVLPSYRDGKILLGFLGGVLIGASVGYLVDQSPATAFFSGYAGYQILESLVLKKKTE